MPGVKRRSDYFKGAKSREDRKKLLAKWPSLSEEDWLALEKILGAPFTPNQRMLIDRTSAVVKSLENLTSSAISITELRKKIKSVRNAVLRHRQDIWHVYRPEAYQMTFSVKSVDEWFFMKRFRIPEDAPLVLLGWAMDALIMTCSSVEKAIKAPEVGLKERRSIIMLGAVMRSVFKDWDLPHTIRKDVDKSKAQVGSGSQFLDFYIELLKRIDCPWRFSDSALATAITRFKIAEDKIPVRVNGRTGKGRK